MPGYARLILCQCHATSEPLAAGPSLRTLLDSQQISIFRPGGVADISIQTFENIRCQVAAMHRVVLLHEVLLQAMRSRNVQDSLRAANFVAAIDKALQLDILSPAEAKFCYLEADIANQLKQLRLCQAFFT